MNELKQERYTKYWAEESQRLLYNIEYLRNATNSKNEDDLFWCESNFQSGAFKASNLLQNPQDCRLIYDYMACFHRLVTDSRLVLLFWKHCYKAALIWTQKLLYIIISRQSSNNSFEHENFDSSSQWEPMVENPLVLLALWLLVKLVTPTKEPNNDYYSKHFHESITKLLKKSSKKELQFVTFSIIGAFRIVNLMYFEELNNKHNLETHCRHSFDCYELKLLDKEIHSEESRIVNLLAKDFTCCGSLCRERLKHSKKFISYNCRPSQLAHHLAAHQVAEALLKHSSFFSETKWSPIGWPCQCLSLIHDKRLITCWLWFILEVFSKLSVVDLERTDNQFQNDSMFMISRITQNYGCSNSIHREEFTSWFIETLLKFTAKKTNSTTDEKP